MKKFFKFFVSSKFLLILALLFNIAIFVTLTILYNVYIYGLISVLVTLIMLIVILTSDSAAPYKIMWLLLVFIVPVFGVCMYIYLRDGKTNSKKRKLWQNINYKSTQFLQPNQSTFDKLGVVNPLQLKESNYILNVTNMPLYQNTTTKFLNNGEEYFKTLFDELKKAEKFIFLEYFIFKQGKIWNDLFEILKNKARQGVEIKLLYDDFGCLDRFDDKNTFRKLANYKIEAVPFNKVGLRMNGFVNYRTHRKIVVIDGRVGFTGGINIGDEYANITAPFGDWKDAGLMLTGEAVWSLSTLFLNSWQFSTKKQIDVSKYKYQFTSRYKSEEFVQPFGTGPLSSETVAQNIYMSLITNSSKYLYITSPYLILDYNTINALKIATKSGVDVRIIFPGIPDKKAPYYLARSYFSDLIKSGVKIYEYTPGFIHEKLLVSDGQTAVVGTINLDFRSLYLHFENGVLIHNSSTVSDIKFDFERTLNSCHMLTLKDMKARKFKEKFVGGFLKQFSQMF